MLGFLLLVVLWAIFCKIIRHYCVVVVGCLMGRAVKFWQMNPNAIGKNPEGVILL
jgi:hypothetical protein